MPNNDSDDKTRSHLQLAHDTVIGHYRIIQKIGSGGMGEVYLAQDSELNRKVALKFLPSHLCQDPECRARFKREAQAAARLSHPNIVTVFEVGEFQGRPFFAMEYVEGQSLYQFAHDRPLPPDTMIDYAIQICQGIAEAHRAGVIHRDIKTSNILVDAKGRARLLDFGLAAVAGDEKLTKTGSTLGTVSYMSPEQVSGREIDGRSDLFSLGIVLYELVTGRTPFRRDSEGATLRAIMQDVPEPLSRYKSEVPERLQQIVDKLLEKDRELRYQTAEDIIADLKRLSYDSQQTAHGPTPKRNKFRRPLLVSGALVAVLLLSAALYHQVRKSHQTIATHAQPMVAVLPFDNLGNPEDEYFADGMTEEITARLAGIRGLGVISRTSAMRYKRSDKSLGQIGRELGVDYVLEGSVRWGKSGGQSRVRITPQLIRVADDRHLWADNYERDLMEVFAVQEDIATKIADQLDLTLLESDRKELTVRPTANPKAYDYYLRGMSGLRQGYWWAMPEMKAAAANLDSAVALDSTFALALAYRSYAYSWLAFSYPTLESRKTARESFEKALELEPNLAYGHLAAGVYYDLVGTDYDAAMTELNQAYSELRGDADLLTNIAVVQLRQGRFDEADENFRRATDLDPLNPVIHALRSQLLAFRRMYADAEQSIDRAIALDPDQAVLYGLKMAIYVSWLGDWSRTREVFREALKHADTLVLTSVLLYWLQTYDFPLDSLLVGTGLQFGPLLERFRDNVREDMEPFMFFWSLAEGYRVVGNSGLSAAYLDSTRQELDKVLKIIPDDAHCVSYLGLVLAELGSCREAIPLGRRALELQTIRKCHW